MRISTKGQVTIPQAIREELGLLPNTEVELLVEDGAVRIVRVEPERGHARGRRLLRSPRGRATVTMSTEEILALTRGS